MTIDLLIAGQTAVIVAGFIVVDRRTQRRCTAIINSITRIDATLVLFEARLAAQEARRNGGDPLAVHHEDSMQSRLNA
jgi:hypothetical protein